MKTEDTYVCMFRDVIRCQIQTLLDQLSNAGEESIVVTVSADSQTQTLGSEAGQKFLQENTSFGYPFLTYCLLNSTKKEPVVPRWSSKRKQEEINGDCNSNSQDSFNCGVETPQKRARVEIPAEMSQQETANTPTKTENLPLRKMAELVKREATILSPATPAVQYPSRTAVSSDSPLPRGHSKCAVCKYSSKFKANVTRHERKVHRLNEDGLDTPTVEYVCALCSYRSSYRSNVMRHEKNVHKLNSTAVELEKRKVVLNQPRSSGNQSMLGDEEDAENQSFLGSTLAVGADDNSRENVDEPEQDVADAEYHVCNYCQLVFASLEQLRNHIDESHLGSQQFNCETCGESFSSMLNLDSHVYTAHTTKQEKCACGKTFQYKMGLLRHARRCDQANIESKDENGPETSMETANDENGVQGTNTDHDEDSGSPVVQIENVKEEEDVQGTNSGNNSDAGYRVETQKEALKVKEDQVLENTSEQMDQSGMRFCSLKQEGN